MNPFLSWFIQWQISARLARLIPPALKRRGHRVTIAEVRESGTPAGVAVRVAPDDPAEAGNLGASTSGATDPV